MIKPVALIVAGLALAAAMMPVGASAASPGQRVDMKVLVLSANGTEPSYDAWKAQLKREGVPFDTFVAKDRHAAGDTLTPSLLAAGSSRAKYQAVIVATGGLYDCSTNPCQSALSQSEWDSLT